MWRSCLTRISDDYQTQYDSLKRKLGWETVDAASAGRGCIDVPVATEVVGRALLERHCDGTNGLVDHAARGSVVHELSSAMHVPPPRNGGFDGGTCHARAQEAEDV